MSDDNALENVQRYRQLVLDYETLDEEIDDYIKKRGTGGIEEMSEAELTHYRELFRRRDDLLNEMRILEKKLRLDEEPE
jgi:hypothetical protein